MNKENMLSVIVTVIVLLIFSGCGNEEKETFVVDSSEQSSSDVMKPVDDKNTKISSEEIKKEMKTTENSKPTKQDISVSENNMKLLKAYGEAYATSSSLNSRNDNLRDLMTKECADLNGINFKTGNGLSSEGKVTSIYQNDKEEYAV